MISEDFEIFYYSDYGLGNLKDHSHDYYEFYFFLSGKVDMIIAGEPHRLSSGDMILIPPQVNHHVEILEKSQSYQRIVFWISKSFAKELENSSEDYAYLIHRVSDAPFLFHFDVMEYNAIQSRILELLEEIHTRRYGSLSMISLDVNELILYINRCVYENSHPNEVPERNSLYENILRYINEHIEEELTLDILSRKFYSSKYYLSHIFKENIGISVHQYIMKKRLYLIKDTMLKNEDINKAIQSYGFHDYSSFYRAFKKEFGVSPRNYMEEHRPLPKRQAEQDEDGAGRDSTERS